MFLHLCDYYVRIICTKGKWKQMWKWVMNLAMIQWQCVSNTKKEWSLTIKLKILKLCFYHVNCDFWWSMVCHEFFCFFIFFLFRHANLFLSFIVVCIHLRCYITSDVRLIMQKTIIQRIFTLKNEKCIILFNVVPMCFFY